jgi:NADPH:quinone reductase
VSAVFVALFDILGLPAPWDADTTRPDSFLIIGGGSNCGRFAVQLARVAGIQNIVVVGGNEEELKKLGASTVVDRHGAEDDIVDAVRNVVGDNLMFALDAVNFPQGLGLALKSLSTKRAGKLARLVPMGDVEDKRGHEILDVLGMFHYRNPACVSMWRVLSGWVKNASLVPSPFSAWEGMTAETVNAALDEYRDGRNKLKPQIVF